MAGKHSGGSGRWWQRRRAVAPARRRTVKMVDARDLTVHQLTLDAAAAGRLPEGRYVAVCGRDILPAALVEPGNRYCQACVVIPAQRSVVTR